jgi:mRNA interferase MazF
MNMMSSGINVRQRDIVLVAFPFSDLSQSKKRPAVIISNREYNSKNEDVICCAITSNVRSYCNSIELHQGDLESGHLTMQSLIKPAKLFTLDKSVIIKSLARLNVKKSKEVVSHLNLSITIDE